MPRLKKGLSEAFGRLGPSVISESSRRKCGESRRDPLARPGDKHGIALIGMEPTVAFAALNQGDPVRRVKRWNNVDGGDELAFPGGRGRRKNNRGNGWSSS